MTPEAREVWLAERRRGIGGSDAPAILGVSPWRSAFEVWLDKLGLAPKPEVTLAQREGTVLEPLILDEYCNRTGAKLVKPPLRWSEKHPWMLASIDAYSTNLKLIVEAKKSDWWGDADDPDYAWGPDGSDRIPIYYRYQVIHYMIVYEVWHADVAAWLPHRTFRVYHLDYDEALGNAIIEGERVFWHEFVVPQVAPQPSALDSVTKALNRLYPEQQQPIIKTSYGPVTALLSEYLVSHRERDEAENRVAAAKNQLKWLIADAEGLEVPGVGGVTWRKNKDGKQTDWRAVALAAGASEELIQQHTQIKAGARALKIAGKKGDE
jgi:putative phage-type endonuclease